MVLDIDQLRTEKVNLDYGRWITGPGAVNIRPCRSEYQALKE